MNRTSRLGRSLAPVAFGTWLGPQACGTRVCGYDRKWYVCGAPLMGGYTCSSMICHWLPQGPCGC